MNRRQSSLNGGVYIDSELACTLASFLKLKLLFNNNFQWLNLTLLSQDRFRALLIFLYKNF